MPPARMSRADSRQRQRNAVNQPALAGGRCRQSSLYRPSACAAGRASGGFGPTSEPGHGTAVLNRQHRWSSAGPPRRSLGLQPAICQLQPGLVALPVVAGVAVPAQEALRIPPDTSSVIRSYASTHLLWCLGTGRLRGVLGRRACAEASTSVRLPPHSSSSGTPQASASLRRSLRPQ